MAGIELKSVRKSFQGFEVIHGIDLEIEDGSFTVFVGPSGCGKSTLLRMMAGLEEVTSGEIHIDGVRCDHLLPSARGMAMVFQSYALYPHMSVEQNLRFGLENQKLPKPEIAARVAQGGRISCRSSICSRGDPASSPAARASASRSAAPSSRSPRPFSSTNRSQQSRRRTARQDARRADQPAPAAGIDDGLRHPRPGRGDDHGGPDRGAERRAASSRSARRSSSTPARPISSSRASSARRR